MTRVGNGDQDETAHNGARARRKSADARANSPADVASSAASGSTVGAPQPTGPRAQCALLLLALASGSVDALALTALGGVFAGVMTGNLVLGGVAAAGAAPLGHAWLALWALLGYAAGTAVVALLTGWEKPSAPATERLWPRRVAAAFAVECGALVVLAGWWSAVGAEPAERWRTLLLVGYAAAMGGQATALLAAGRGGAPTTYFTSTLTTLLARLTTGTAHGTRRAQEQPADGWIAARLGCLLAGAALAAALHTVHPAPAAALPALAVLGALALAGRA